MTWDAGVTWDEGSSWDDGNLIAVSAIAPDNGPWAGTVQVTLTGQLLETVEAVRFGPNSASNVTVDPSGTSIAMTLPSGSEGAVDVGLRLADGRELVLPGAFTYWVPTITGMAPTEGGLFGGTVVTITGTHLSQVHDVTFVADRWWRPGSILTVTDTVITVQTPIASAETGQMFNGPADVEVWLFEAAFQAGTFTYVGDPPPFIPEPLPFKRQAWLTLGERRLPLDDLDAGYVCRDIDFAYPTVREVTDSWSGRDGANDRTSLFGPRAVTATITMWEDHPMTRERIARLFHPYVNVRSRPVLHYTLDDPTDERERVLTLRPSEFGAPYDSNAVGEIQLSWVAPDPIIYSAEERTATAGPAGVRTGGLVFPTNYDLPRPPIGEGNPVRAHPADGMPFRIEATTGAGESPQIVTDGDMDAYPMLRIQGPITAPRVTITNLFDDGTRIVGLVGFRSSFIVDIHRWIEIDTQHRTVTGDDGAHLEAQVATWGETWPTIAADAINILSITGGTVDANTAVIATWHDGWIIP